MKTGEVDREKRAMEYYVSRAIEQVERLLNHHSDLEPTMLTQRAIYQLHMGETKKCAHSLLMHKINLTDGGCMD